MMWVLLFVSQQDFRCRLKHRVSLKIIDIFSSSSSSSSWKRRHNGCSLYSSLRIFFSWKRRRYRTLSTFYVCVSLTYPQHNTQKIDREEMWMEIWWIFMMETCFWILQTRPDFCGSVWGEFPNRWQNTLFPTRSSTTSTTTGTQTVKSPKDGSHPRTVLESTNRSVKDADSWKTMQWDCTRLKISVPLRNSPTTCLRIDLKVYISDPKSYTTKRQNCSCCG